VSKATRTKTCAHCGTNFSYEVARGADRIYCSSACASRATILRHPPDRVCIVEGCQNGTRPGGLTYCEMHYGRLRRNGHLELLPKRQRGICAVDGCESPARNRGMCGMHAERVRRYGDPHALFYPVGSSASEHPQWVGDSIGYYGLHVRLRAALGPASAQRCVDCAGQAHHWSYDHCDPAERQAREGAYSPDLSHYQPRCRSCHKVFDLAHA